MTRRHDTKATSELEFPETAIGFEPAGHGRGAGPALGLRVQTRVQERRAPALQVLQADNVSARPPLTGPRDRARQGAGPGPGAGLSQQRRGDGPSLTDTPEEAEATPHRQTSPGEQTVPRATQLKLTP